MENQTIPTLQFEQRFWNQGHLHVAGVDEAGRGCWAGPVTAGAVILPDGQGTLTSLEGVRDSKVLTPKQRETLFGEIKRTALCWAVGWSSNVEIDAFGIVPATRLAMSRAINSLQQMPEALLIDAVKLPTLDLPQQSMNFGDKLSLSIAAASICAKVARDQWMLIAESRFPGYGFAQHKGYGTKHHQQALAVKGPCELHRFSFRPLRL
jgi:ribonuclease HII